MAAGSFFSTLATDLGALKRSPRELWLVYGVKLFESIGFFAVYNVLIVYLSDDLGMTDVQAGSWAGTWLTFVSLAVFLSGPVADSIGIKNALWLAVASSTLGRALLCVHSREVALLGLFLSGYGTGAIVPTCVAAVRRYTTKETVSFGFSLFYVLMNVAGLIGPVLVALLRKGIPRKETVQVLGLPPLTSSQAIFMIATVATACCVGVLVFFREGTAPSESAPVKTGRENPLKVLLEVTRESAFWRFMLFVTLLVFVRLIFQHAHLTWPKYTQREFGADFAFAAWWSINPALIIIFTPIATALTRRGSPFFWILVGSTITSVSVFFMALSTSLVASVLFIVTLSIGEMLWSPRLYEYTAAIAPRGRESTYMGLSDIPRFLAKPAVGFISGLMLATYCPADGARRSQVMWAIIGAMTLAGPIAILFLRRVIEGRERGTAASTEETTAA